MKRKWLTAVMSVTLAAGTFAGYGAKAQAADNSITVWVPPYAGSTAELTDQDFWDQQFDAFEAENNCTVTVEIIPWDGYKQKVTTGLTSGEGPDVVYIDTPYDLVAAGAFEPLDSYFTQEEKDNYIYWDLGQIQGKQYVAPMLVGNASVLYCNMDILKEAGFDTVPQTWDDLLEYSKKIKETNPDVQPFSQCWGETGKAPMMLNFLPYYWQTGADFLDAEGKPAIDNENGLKTVEFLKSFLDEGIFDEGIVAVTDLSTQFAEGKLAMFVGDTGSAGDYTDAGINWDFTPSLTETAEGKQATWIAADSLALASNSDNKELAVKAIKYMLSAPVMDAFHEKMYAMCPITKDAKYYDDEKFQKMYTEQADVFHNWPSFANSDALYDALLKNFQSMYMGDMEPQEVLTDAMQQYNDFAQ